jgi:hypothetical protein
MNTEPVITAASIAGLLSAGISFCRLMGWIALNDDQYNSLMIFIGMALPIGLGIWARQQTTPLSRPRDTDGQTLSRPGDVPAKNELAALQTDALEINASGGLK